MRLESLQAWAREHMVRDWRESLRREWEYDPKHRTNLFEHYYADPGASERSVQVRDRVNRCLEHFRRSATYEELLGLRRRDWLAVEELEQVEVEGVPVWVMLDCAYRLGSQVVVADWKTGAVRSEHRTQLEVYALYAVQAWKGVVPEDVVLRGVYLNEDKEVDSVVSEDDLDALRERIRESVAAMREPLEDPDANVAREEAAG